jgi:co-chaperonin GroES (HSP10)
MSVRAITPVLGNIIVVPEVEEKTTSSGIFTGAAAPTNRGVVLAIGPGSIHEKTGERMPCDVSIGDRVIFSQHAEEVNVDGISYRILTQELIHCIIPDGAA